MEIIVPIGISGSGKSTMYKSMYSDYNIVCPDQIRLELTGDISDQSKNDEVFELVDKMIDECIANDTSCFYDATNVNSKFRREFVKRVKKHPNVKVVYVYLPANVNESFERITRDIEENKVRSNVPIGVLKRQMDMYMSSINSNWRLEGADEAILIKDDELMKKYIDKISVRNFSRIIFN